MVLAHWPGWSAVHGDEGRGGYGTAGANTMGPISGACVPHPVCRVSCPRPCSVSFFAPPPCRFLRSVEMPLMPWGSRLVHERRGGEGVGRGAMTANAAEYRPRGVVPYTLPCLGTQRSDSSVKARIEVSGAHGKKAM